MHQSIGDEIMALSEASKKIALLQNRLDLIDLTTRERLKWHRESLEQWKSGLLTPTEPDTEERARVIRGLEGAIHELEVIRNGIFPDEKEAT